MTRTQSWPGVHLLATTTDARKAISGLIVKNTAGMPRSGVFPRHTSGLVTARADMNVDVGVFEAAAVQFGGTILFTNDGVAQLPSALVSPGAGITNYYVVYAKQNENTSPGTDANNNAILGTVLSTVSFAAARATLPTGAVELGTVEIPTGKTATNNAGVVITTTCQYTAAAGGVVWLQNATEATAWTPADGSVAWRVDLGVLFERKSGAWSRVTPQMKMGVYTYTTDGSGLGYIIHGLGVTPSNVQVTSRFLSDVSAPLQMVSIGTVTSTQIQLVAHRNDTNARLTGTAISVYWVAWA